MVNEDAKNKLRGTIVFLKANEGSKSEAEHPFLYRKRNVPMCKVMLRGDNPFENNGLTSYDGRLVELVGETALSGTFIVDEVRLLSMEESQS